MEAAKAGLSPEGIGSGDAPMVEPAEGARVCSLLGVRSKTSAMKTGAMVEGSPARALKVNPPFDGYYFIDLNEEKADYLRSICGNRSDVHIHTGDCNDILTKE